MIRLLCCAALLAVAAVAQAQAGPEQVWIPLKTSSRVLKLEATLYRPQGEGPFPVLLFSHGSTGGGRTPASTTLRPATVAPEFLARGFVVLAPMRRGRGASEGSSDEVISCDDGRLWQGIEEAIQDTDAALAYLKTLAYVDTGRLVLSGQSRGGFLSVIYSAKHPGLARGVVNYVGGWTGDWGCNAAFNATSFRQAGERNATPMLWIYAEGDHYYQPESIRRYAALYDNGRGADILRLFPRLPGNTSGHSVGRFPDLWRKDLNDFLDRVGFAKP